MEADTQDHVQDPSPERNRQTAPVGGFVRRFVGWLFFVMAASFAAGVAAVFVHEFSHGLTALASGGYFLGVQGEIEGPIFADAWSDGHEILVYSAGIAVTVALGVGLWRLARRIDRLIPRILLLIAAGSFLSDLEYAVEGCLGLQLGEQTSDMDFVLDTLGSPGLRCVLLVIFSGALIASKFAVAADLFRCWERVFGPLSLRRALWIALLLSGAFSGISSGEGASAIGTQAILVLQVVVATWLVVNRDRTCSAQAVPTVSFLLWSLVVWPTNALAVAGMLWIEKGIHLGTFPSTVISDVRPAERLVAGYVFRYGWGNDPDGEHVHRSTELFLAREDGVHTMESPSLQIVDVFYDPGGDALAVVCDQGLLSVRLSNEQQWLWRPPRGEVTGADHDEFGNVVLTLDVPSFDEKEGASHPVYLYDFRRRLGTFIPNPDKVGYPFFEPNTKPAKAWVTVGRDLLEIDWVGEGPPRHTLHKEDSGDLFFAGKSGDRSWFGNEDGWGCGEARVSADPVTYWGAGSGGFYTIRDDGTWQRTTVSGEIDLRGTVDTDSVIGLFFVGGIPWIGLSTGVVRELETPGRSFRVELPR